MLLSKAAGAVLPQNASLAMNSLTATNSYKQPALHALVGHATCRPATHHVTDRQAGTQIVGRQAGAHQCSKASKQFCSSLLIATSRHAFAG